MFLPLADRGVDALVHRLTDGTYVPVQAKSRSTLKDGEVHLVILAESLIHDDIVIVAGLLVDGGLGPTALVVPVGDFKRLANLGTDQGKALYSMEFGMRPRSDSRWLPWLVPPERVVERFGIPAVGVEAVVIEPRPQWRGDVAFLGEAEVTRRLAEAGDLNLFRAFPDSETVEIAVLHLDSRQVLGLQVKTVDVDRERPRAMVDVYASSFRPSRTTYFVVLAWRRDEGRFDEECLLIPSAEISELASDDGSGHLSFDFHPGSTDVTRADIYKRQLAELTAEVEGQLT